MPFWIVKYPHKCVFNKYSFIWVRIFTLNHQYLRESATSGWIVASIIEWTSLHLVEETCSPILTRENTLVPSRDIKITFQSMIPTHYAKENHGHAIEPNNSLSSLQDMVELQVNSKRFTQQLFLTIILNYSHFWNRLSTQSFLAPPILPRSFCRYRFCRNS